MRERVLFYTNNKDIDQPTHSMKSEQYLRYSLFLNSIGYEYHRQTFKTLNRSEYM